MLQNKYIPCGGCGATEPIQRCIGCFHPFMPVNRFCHIEWVNLATHFTEDWEIMHCRYASDGYKLDTDLFELKDGGLVKKGGTGRLELKEVEYMVDLGASDYAALCAKVERYEKALKDIAKQRTCDEQEADEETPIGSDGTRLGDINMGYDCCIATAREALEQEGEKEPVSQQGPVDNTPLEDLLRRRLERAWIRGWVDRIQHERNKPPLDREKEIEEIMKWDGDSGEPYLIQSEG